MILKITPADKAEVREIVRKSREFGTYKGLTEALKKLEPLQGIWVECPEGVSISKHQTHLASISQSLHIHSGIRFMTRRDTENNRVAVVRVE